MVLAAAVVAVAAGGVVVVAEAAVVVVVVVVVVAVVVAVDDNLISAMTCVYPVVCLHCCDQSYPVYIYPSMSEHGTCYKQ